MGGVAQPPSAAAHRHAARARRGFDRRLPRGPAAPGGCRAGRRPLRPRRRALRRSQHQPALPSPPWARTAGRAPWRSPALRGRDRPGGAGLLDGGRRLGPPAAPVPACVSPRAGPSWWRPCRGPAAVAPRRWRWAWRR